MVPQALPEEVMPAKVAASLRATPMPSVITTRITSPPNGATVAQKIAVEGVIAGLQPDQHVFVCVQSQAFGRRIYPQGKVRPDASGQWTVESIYGSSGYSYETYLVITTNTAAAAMLHAQQSRKYGMRDLPPTQNVSVQRLSSCASRPPTLLWPVSASSPWRKRSMRKPENPTEECAYHGTGYGPLRRHRMWR